jgi:hypothetical protein
MQYKIKSGKHKDHIVEIREIVMYQGLMKVYCLTCNQYIYESPDNLEKIQEG